jgi:hypothetical protein
MKIGSPDFVITWITEGVPLCFNQTPSRIHLKNPHFSQNEMLFIDNEIHELLKSGAIKRCEKGEVPWCVSPIKTVKGRKGKRRLITDLRGVNTYIEVPKFSQEGIEVVADLIDPGDLMLTVDLKSGFHHCKIQQEYQKYLGFYHKGQYYTWCALPFGLKSSPYYFHKLLRPVVKYLRENGLKVVFYVDDCILLAPKSVSTDHKDLLLNTLGDLGLTINVEKSSLEFDTIKHYLGYTINSLGDNGYPILKVKSERLHQLKKDLNRVLQRDCVTARKLARIAGQCISMTKAIIPGKLLLRNVYSAIKKKVSWDSFISLDEALVHDLKWWYNALDSWNGAPIKLRP